jgi:hypothetical protein
MLVVAGSFLTGRREVPSVLSPTRIHFIGDGFFILVLKKVGITLLPPP